MIKRVVLSALIIGVLLFSGCGEKDNDDEDDVEGGELFVDIWPTGYLNQSITIIINGDVLLQWNLTTDDYDGGDPYLYSKDTYVYSDDLIIEAEESNLKFKETREFDYDDGKYIRIDFNKDRIHISQQEDEPDYI